MYLYLLLQIQQGQQYTCYDCNETNAGTLVSEHLSPPLPPPTAVHLLWPHSERLGTGAEAMGVLDSV